MPHTTKLRDEQHLPPCVRTVLEEIEAATGADVLVGQMPSEIASVNQAGFHCDHSYTWPPTMTVHYRDSLEQTGPDCPRPYYGVYHELLHLHRQLVQCIPQILSIDDGTTTVKHAPQISDPRQIANTEQRFKPNYGHLDNILEHLWIDPLVNKAFGCEATVKKGLDHWNAVPPPPWNNEHLRRWFNVVSWIETWQSQKVVPRATQVLDSQGLLGDASLLTDCLEELLMSTDLRDAKESAIVLSCGALGIPQSAVRVICCTGAGFSVGVRTEGAVDLWATAKSMQAD